jgi:hypothetical protein
MIAILAGDTFLGSMSMKKGRFDQLVESLGEVRTHVTTGRFAGRIISARRPERGAPVSRGFDAMKDEYDFSKGDRGRFHRPSAVLVHPVHLDPEVLAFLAARGEARGVSLSELVNALLKKDIELIEAAG